MIKKLILAIFSAFALHQTMAADHVGPLQYLEDRYNELSPKAKFATTAAIGFVGTRIALNTAMGVIKLGVAAFITTEILHHTGVLNDLPPLSKEHNDILENVKTHVLRHADTFRVQVHRKLNPESIQSIWEKERIGAFGLASGAIFGTLL